MLPLDFPLVNIHPLLFWKEHTHKHTHTPYYKVFPSYKRKELILCEKQIQGDSLSCNAFIL